jgi:uncharacterized protein (TIGR04141 family)
LCGKLLEIYDSNAYEATLPHIQNIVPVRDPAIIDQLCASLEGAVRSKAHDVYLAVPEIVNYDDNVFVAFNGVGRSLIYDDVSVARYYEYIENNSIDITSLTLEEFKQHNLLLTDEQGLRRQSFSNFRSLILIRY